MRATERPGSGLGIRRLIAEEKALASMFVMALAGFGISVYLTVVHYAHVPLVCTTGGVVSCAAVTSSPYSVVPGTSVPITIPGMLWFVIVGVLATIGLRSAYHGKPEPGWLRPTCALWGLAGLVVVLGLVYAEIVLLHRICEWCTAVHALTLLVFLTALGRLGREEAAQE